MTYEQFEEFKQQNHCHTLPEYYSETERYSRFLEAVKHTGHFRNEALLNVYFQKFRPFCMFQKTEQHSGDVVDYCLGLDESVIFFSDVFRTAMIRIGYCWNAACGFRKEYACIEQFFLSEHGSFYAQNADGEIRCIAETLDTFLDYLVVTEYDHHAVITEETCTMMKDAGWYRGRCTDLTALIQDCTDRNIVLSEQQIGFLQEFGGLTIQTADKTIEIGICRKEYPFAEYFAPITDDADSFEGQYMAFHDVTMVCIGSTHHPSDDSYNALWLTSDGRLIWDVGGRCLGRTPMEGFQILISR